MTDMTNDSPAPNEEYYEKFYALEPMTDAKFAIRCAEILAESVDQYLRTWLPVLGFEQISKPREGSNKVKQLIIDLDLVETVGLMEKALADDFRVIAFIAIDAHIKLFFSLSHKRIVERINKLQILDTLDRLASDPVETISRNVLRLNLSTGRDRLRMATRMLDRNATDSIEKAKQTSFVRFRAEIGSSAEMPQYSEADKAYRTGLLGIEEALSSSREMSRKAGYRPSENSQMFWSSVLFTRLCVSLVSLMKLLPGSSYSAYKTDHWWDHSAVCTLTRAVLECFLLHFYLCVDEVSEDEQHARLQLMFIHDCTMRLRVFYDSPEATEPKVFYEAELIRLTDNLQANPYFATLSEKQQRHFLKGRDLFFLNQDEILARIDGIDIAHFRKFYEYLSSHVHSLPVSFYKVLEDDRGRGVENDAEKGYISQCLGFLCLVMLKAQSHFTSIFPDVGAEDCY